MEISNEQQERRENLKARIMFATKTVSEWMVEDEIIRKGEPTIAIPDGYNPGTSNIRDFRPIFKIGDGKHVWSELPEIGGGGVGDLVVLEKEDKNQSDNEFLQNEMPEPAEGAMVVVVTTFVEDDEKTEVNEEKKSRTAYIYKDGAWEALDGNYSADNVYLDSDIQLAGDYTQVGNITKGANETKILTTKGKSLSEVFDTIFTQELESEVTKPTCTITLEGAGSHEVGTVLNPKYTTTFNNGAYTYGPDTGTGVSATKYTATLNGVSVEGVNGDFGTLMVTDGMNIKASLTVQYTEGVLADTNLGNQGTVRIEAGSCIATSGAITGYRNMFYKVLESNVTLSSDVVRGWTKQRSTVSELVLEANVVNSPTNIVIVTIDEIDKVLLTSAQNSDITSEFKMEGDLMVNGASTGTETLYKVYKYQPASLDKSEKYKITFK